MTFTDSLQSLKRLKLDSFKTFFIPVEILYGRKILVLNKKPLKETRKV